MSLPFATHERSDGRRLAEVELEHSGGDGAGEEFGIESKHVDEDGVSPRDAVVEQTQVRSQTREGKVLREVHQTERARMGLVP
jgi:hypothetical protein